ncbi:helix-turn-helix transcriptional regulator [Halobacillus amylolyticus]|uniref:AraC family transcriptional regulator n=1 Tax=Halobacillus amylolyticus TaxID=2932259 RepID=A0ABY4HDY2_9BACI|nr:AraC family transcriptional regulator [Halobacillus amylolyticus]UOR12872.1 AraC family transcriptional regulator [Halobacillus amylolyticus]
MILDSENGLLLMRNDHLDERNWRSDDCYKLIFSPFGRGDYQTQRGDITIDHGEFFIFNPNEVHKQLKATKEKFLVEIQPSLLRDAADHLGFKHTDPEFSMVSYKHPQIRQWVSFVRDFLSLNDGASSAANQFFLDHSLTQLSIMMLQYGTGSHQSEFPIINSQANINDAIKALKESYNEDWTLDEMAAAARLNKYQFAHLFKEELGLSPYSWLQLYRLFRSQNSLLHTNDSILSLALQHGFKSVSSYNHLFKKVYRKTPSEFRRIHGFKK